MTDAPDGEQDQGAFVFEADAAPDGLDLAEPHLTPDSAEATQLFNQLLAMNGNNPALALVHACEVLAKVSGAASAGYSRGPIVGRVTTRSDQAE